MSNSSYIILAANFYGSYLKDHLFDEKIVIPDAKLSQLVDSVSSRLQQLQFSSSNVYVFFLIGITDFVDKTIYKSKYILTPNKDALRSLENEMESCDTLLYRYRTYPIWSTTYPISLAKYHRSQGWDINNMNFRTVSLSKGLVHEQQQLFDMVDDFMGICHRINRRNGVGDYFLTKQVYYVDRDRRRLMDNLLLSDGINPVVSIVGLWNSDLEDYFKELRYPQQKHDMMSAAASRSTDNPKQTNLFSIGSLPAPALQSVKEFVDSGERNLAHSSHDRRRRDGYEDLDVPRPKRARVGDDLLSRLNDIDGETQKKLAIGMLEFISKNVGDDVLKAKPSVAAASLCHPAEADNWSQSNWYQCTDHYNSQLTPLKGPPSHHKPCYWGKESSGKADSHPVSVKERLGKSTTKTYVAFTPAASTDIGEYQQFDYSHIKPWQVLVMDGTQAVAKKQLKHIKRFAVSKSQPAVNALLRYQQELFSRLMVTKPKAATAIAETCHSTHYDSKKNPHPEYAAAVAEELSPEQMQQYKLTLLKLEDVLKKSRKGKWCLKSLNAVIKEFDLSIPRDLLNVFMKSCLQKKQKEDIEQKQQEQQQQRNQQRQQDQQHEEQQHEEQQQQLKEKTENKDEDADKATKKARRKSDKNKVYPFPQMIAKFPTDKTYYKGVTTMGNEPPRVDCILMAVNDHTRPRRVAGCSEVDNVPSNIMTPECFFTIPRHVLNSATPFISVNTYLPGKETMGYPMTRLQCQVAAYNTANLQLRRRYWKLMKTLRGGSDLTISLADNQDPPDLSSYVKPSSLPEVSEEPATETGNAPSSAAVDDEADDISDHVYDPLETSQLDDDGQSSSERPLPETIQEDEETCSLPLTNEASCVIPTSQPVYSLIESSDACGDGPEVTTEAVPRNEMKSKGVESPRAAGVYQAKKETPADNNTSEKTTSPEATNHSTTETQEAKEDNSNENDTCSSELTTPTNSVENSSPLTHNGGTVEVTPSQDKPIVATSVASSDPALTTMSSTEPSIPPPPWESK